MAPDNHSRPTGPAWAAALSSDGHSISLLDGKDGTTLNRFWLRDLCPSLPTKQSGLRTSSVASLPEDLRAVAATVELPGETLSVEWNDGHHSRYRITELLLMSDRARGRRPPLAPIGHFVADHQPATFVMADLAWGSAAHHDLLDAVATEGFALVDRMEPRDDTTEQLARLLGRVRETDFGRIFDIITEPVAWTLSQSASGQDPHSDDPYRYRPSGISILHCRQAAGGSGGTSILVDGLKIAADLRREAPEDFRLLSSVSIPWVRYRPQPVDQGDDVNMVAYAPVISVNQADEIIGIRFHERSSGVFDLTPDLIDAYYLAFRQFALRVRSPDYQWIHRLGDGQAIVFDNQRVLHGRTGYEDDAAGRRHMRLCTIDRDQVHSRLRRLREIHDRGGVDVRLRSGSHSM